LQGWISTAYLPPYAPELNPVEYIWSYWKQHELPNVCPKDYWQLSEAARRTLRRMRRRPRLITAFWKQSSFMARIALYYARFSKTLDQAEIHALFNKAQTSRDATASRPSKKVVPCDLRRTNQLSADQVVAVTKLNESFARRLSSSLGAHLRVAFEMNLVSVEQLTYREFIGRLRISLTSLHCM
jgi:hypothetical protein